MSPSSSSPAPDRSTQRAPIGLIGITTLVLLFLVTLIAGLAWNGEPRRALADNCPPGSNNPCSIKIGCPDTAGCHGDSSAVYLAVKGDFMTLVWSAPQSGTSVLMLTEGDTHGFKQSGPVDSSEVSGSGFSFAYDARQNPALAFCDAQGLAIATRSSTPGRAFRFVHPDRAASRVVSPALAEIPDGIAVAYCDASHGCLKYAERTAKGWKTVIVDRNHPASGISLVASGSARAIASYDPANGDLRIARRRNGVWSSQIVDGAGDVGRSPSMIGNPAAGRLGIAYYDRSNGDLKYAWTRSDRWNVQAVATEGDVGSSCSLIAYGNSVTDSIAIAYHDSSHGRLEYAEKIGGAWNHETLDPVSGSGVAISCAPVPTRGGIVRLGYVRSGGDLCYLEKMVGHRQPGAR